MTSTAGSAAASGQDDLLSVLQGFDRTESMVAAARYRAVFLLARQWEDRYGVPADQVSNVTIRALRAEIAAAVRLRKRRRESARHRRDPGPEAPGHARRARRRPLLRPACASPGRRCRTPPF